MEECCIGSATDDRIIGGAVPTVAVERSLDLDLLWWGELVSPSPSLELPHPRWQERPLLLIHRKPGREPSKQDILDYLSDKIAKWWMPDDVQFIDAIPHGATGKILKTRLREDFKDYKLPTA